VTVSLAYRNLDIITWSVEYSSLRLVRDTGRWVKLKESALSCIGISERGGKVVQTLVSAIVGSAIASY
jgi:hypothetical protein